VLDHHLGIPAKAKRWPSSRRLRSNSTRRGKTRPAQIICFGAARLLHQSGVSDGVVIEVAIEEAQQRVACQFDGSRLGLDAGQVGLVGCERHGLGNSAGLASPNGTNRAAAGLTSVCFKHRSVQSEDREQRRVDLPLLVDCDAPDLVTETFHGDRSELLDEQARAPTADVELRPKRCRPGARRRWSDQHDRTREHGVALQDHGQPAGMLFVSDALGQSNLVDVSALQAGRSGSQLFHEIGNGRHLGSIVPIRLQSSDFCRERLSVS
jgi:hypothetical protein